MSKNLIYLKDFSKKEIFQVFELADAIAAGGDGKLPLQGKTILLFFPDSSIRTRVTFEKGIQLLGGSTILFPPASLEKKEKIEDVIGYLENWADAVVVRHSDLTLVEEMAGLSHIPIVNAMTSQNHPCEIISDLYALSKIRHDFLKDKYLFLGAKGNIGNSWKAAAERMGFEMEQCCPPGYELEGIRSYRNPDEAVEGKDVICTDSIPDKAKEDFKGYQITLRHMQRANPGAVLNPCPPFYRGEEVSDEVISSDYFVGYGFKKHLLTVQQAIICYLIEKNSPHK